MPSAPKAAFPTPAATLPGEADILANVLADLSDDTAKLVYADWLEEHDDKRGPLLREFVTAYRAGKKKLPPLKPVPKAWRDLVGLTLITDLKGTALEAHTDKLLAVARPSINFDAMKAAEKSLPIGASKLGGLPDVPEGTEWPARGGQPLSFLGQFNLADLHASPVARDLPATGLFSVYVRYDEDEGSDDFPKGSWRVLYFPDLTKLVRPEPEDLQPGESRFRSCRVAFDEVLTIPDPDSPWFRDLKLSKDEEVNGDYFQLHIDMCPGDHILGHPFPIQNDVLGKKATRHLMTICGSDAAGWEFGDGGALYFTLSEADLKAGRFDRVKMEMQCG